MAKDKLTEYSATNASNDVIGDISVAEGMLPSAVNNALREQMTHLKNFSDGTDAIDALAVDNLKLDGNTISSTNLNGNVTIDPNGTGNTVVSSGSVGIGNSSPDSYYSNSNQLVVGSGAARQGITIASSTSTIGQLAFADGTSGDARYEGWVIYDHNTDHMSLGTSAEERLRIDSSGNVGIGVTSTAGGKLAIGGTGTSAAYQYMSNTGGTGYFGVSSSTGGGILIGDSAYSLVLGTGGATPLHFGTNNNIRATIDSSGNVGIGTSSPDTNLDVERSGNDTGGIKVQNTNNAQASAVAQVEISGGDNAYANLLLECNATNHSIRQDGSGNLKFINASTERLRIDSSGRVGIGTSNPEALLHVEGASTGQMMFRTSASSVNKWLIGKNSSSDFSIGEDGNEWLYVVRDSGTLLLGTGTLPDGSADGVSLASTQSQRRFSINSTANSNQILFYNGNGLVGLIATNGTATAYATSSDYRLKENVTYDWDATTRLKQLKPARFNFIADADTTVDGFLAHEAQAVVPEAITGTHNEVDDDGNPVYQGIDQSKLVPLLVKTIQELEARIAALEAN